MQTNDTQTLKIGVIGGMRGDDRFGLEVLTYFFSHNKPQLQLLLGNYRALEEGKPYIDIDLMLAGRGDEHVTMPFEKQRAFELTEVLDVCTHTIDIHGSYVHDNVVVVFDMRPTTLAFAQTLRPHRIVYINQPLHPLASHQYGVMLIAKTSSLTKPTPSDVAPVVFNIIQTIGYLEAGSAAPTSIPVENFEVSADEINPVDMFLKSGTEQKP